MRLILPTIGSGTNDDPIRVNYPSFTFVRELPGHSAWVVDVPDDCLPHGFDPGAGTVTVGNVAVPDPRLLGLLRVRAWHAFLDERYQEHAGRFRPLSGA